MKISIKILSAVLSLAVLIVSVPINASANESVESIKAQIEAKEAQIASYQQKIDALEKDASKQEEYIDELQEQIDAYDEELDLLNDQISALNSDIGEIDAQIKSYEEKIGKLEDDIEEVNREIDEKNKLIDDTYDLLSERLVATYKAGETSELEVFLTATDFQDFLTRTELIRKVAEHDNKIVKDLENTIKSLNKMVEELDKKKEELDENKTKLDTEKGKLVASKATLDESKASLNSQINTVQGKVDKVNSIINGIDKQSSQYEKMMEKANAEIAAFNREIETLINNSTQSGSGTVVNTDSIAHNFEKSTMGIICPLQGATVSINEYSWNHAKRGFRNTATDFGMPSGSFGKPIYAVAGGKILKAAFNTYNGNYILIDHGNGLVTYYGHCNSMIVSAGQSIKQGQVIGYVGKTGYVTGPHLHFEVRVNGKQQAPENYLKSANGGYVSPISA
ncbi:MAG: peptidoglycan DD-metalloendopeptidase family protein [Clostridiales bacterium]|nr:peptidoglycan DD-metalloendopeptidase family protein [Clostridiales bacterium]